VEHKERLSHEDAVGALRFYDMGLLEEDYSRLEKLLAELQMLLEHAKHDVKEARNATTQAKNSSPQQAEVKFKLRVKKILYGQKVLDLDKRALLLFVPIHVNKAAVQPAVYLAINLNQNFYGWGVSDLPKPNEAPLAAAGANTTVKLLTEVLRYTDKSEAWQNASVPSLLDALKSGRWRKDNEEFYSLVDLLGWLVSEALRFRLVRRLVLHNPEAKLGLYKLEAFIRSWDAQAKLQSREVCLAPYSAAAPCPVDNCRGRMQYGSGWHNLHEAHCSLCDKRPATKHILVPDSK